ncbi:MAG: HNH endonuclease [Thermoanaerobaculia bacterium]
MRSWHAQNRTRRLKTGKIWYSKNRDEHIRRANTPERNRKRYLANPDYYKDAARDRKARKRAAFVETVRKKDIYARDNGRCRWCGAGLSFKEATLDHLVPLARNGKHEIANVILSCKSCNLSKGASVAPRGRVGLLPLH